MERLVRFDLDRWYILLDLNRILEVDRVMYGGRMELVVEEEVVDEVVVTRNFYLRSLSLRSPKPKSSELRKGFSVLYCLWLLQRITVALIMSRRRLKISLSIF